MRKALPWIFGIAIALILIGWLGFGRSDRQAYRAARGAINQRVEMSQDRIDMAVEMATKSVDLALVAAGNLPSQEAAADLVKQDITEIGNRLKEAAELKGDAAIAKLDESIEQFNQTLETVDDAAKSAENPAVKSTLDRIYGILEGVKEQLVQAVLNSQE
jgi:predicted HNH restriction endonuclease